ncbi:MAG: MBL fold metallo-hydrolase [Lachnospiraceae bacterium]
MNITYIHHSGFLVELDSLYLLFDYVGGSLPDLNPDKQLFVFASHRHGDHFSVKIYDLTDLHPNVQYVLSDDIFQNQVPEDQSCRTEFIDAGSSLDFSEQNLHITAFHSTDEGVAFLAEHNGQSVYHAGDLNHWHWDGEPDDWNRQMADNYRQELERIKAYGVRPNIAFLPLDGRQGEWFWVGLDEFMNTVGADMVFPMHFWRDYSVIDKLKALPNAASYKDRVADIKNQGQVFGYK